MPDDSDLQELAAVALCFHGTEGSVQGLMEIVKSPKTATTARANFDVFPSWLVRALTTTTL